jgi:hypothetical protein
MRLDECSTDLCVGIVRSAKKITITNEMITFKTTFISGNSFTTPSVKTIISS